MTRSALILVLACLVSIPVAAQRRRPVTHASSERILWVAAHPDDELLVAPFLAQRCRGDGALCAFAVATRGEAGTCGLASCEPDLATVRSRELASAASYLGAFVIPGTLPDAALDASGDALQSFVLGAIAAFDPDLVVTFDPRHGSTCHRDHRAVGAAVLALRARGAFAEPVAVLTSRATVAGSWESLTFDPGLADATTIVDAGAVVPRLGATGWDVLLEIARIHRSQFPDEAVAALAAVPDAARAIGLRLLVAGEVLSGDRCATP